MDDLTIGRTSTSHEPLSPERLAALVSSRLCHDLISPLGAIGNGLELLQMSDAFKGVVKSAEYALIAESVEASRSRVRWFRMAFGTASSEQRVSLSELTGILSDLEKGGRLRARIEAEGDLPRIEARMILLALMCFETGLPWGGSVLVCRGPQGWRLVAEATRAKIDPALWAWLDPKPGRERPDPVPSEVHFALLAACAESAGRGISWELDESGGEISF
ncbi:histidine phosphotransferase family protein [Paracoccus aestuariivivens]|uniref:Histidine phosphotransferase n=1 Tax=Paracoccus aestuariivivens TaxID=1820333 RepID=A0A6L6J6R6_9RHOB|nr:histidine phosphotransferase family protein [Paracoccus aestuariivivens]MTH77276.1 histidine phosphotransferase [Paracoccus aestuariivivens]